MSKIILKEESYRLMGILFKVHNTLGPICKEKNYQDAVEILLKQNNIPYEREKELFMLFSGDRLSGFFADFVIDNKIILELKAAKSIKNEDIRQTLRYLEAANLPLGIIANFKRQKLEHKRVLNPKAINSLNNLVQPDSNSIRAIRDGLVKGQVRIIFFGTPEFAGNTLRKLVEADFCQIVGVVTVPDKPVGRKQELTPPPVKVAAQELGIPVWQPVNLKPRNRQSPLRETLAGIDEWDADLFVVIAYGKIIPQDILDIPKFGAINIHYSLLPKYRGAAPVQYALLNGDKETGVSIILLDEKMDHGPVIGNWKLEIGNFDTSETLFEKLAVVGDKLLLKTIPKYVTGKIGSIEQDHSKAAYTKIIRKEDGLVDWSKPAQKIYNMWRAFQPWPGIHTKTQKHKNTKTQIVGAPLVDAQSHVKTIKLLDVKIFDGQLKNKNIQPGQFFVKDGGLLARCGGGTYLEVLKLQVEGKKAMVAGEFINGYLK